MTETKVKLEYDGSKGWLIFWLVVFFPIGLTLLITSGKFQLDQKTYYLRYQGSQNWLCFWVAIFFPVAIVLLVLNGVSVVVRDL